MTGANEIRKTFIDHFSTNDHEIVSSSPLLPLNDPTLMFVNSGMVQFKNVFVGAEQRPYKRAVTAQKCLRAGGKHNDLDNVGYTSRHHTFFEMLGNFSFGDYFKDQAIELAWSLITKRFDLPEHRLLVTVHSSDEEAASLWRRIADLPDERIIRINTSDNFWQMGDLGPCGPCSEIFFDHGDKIPGGPPGSADQDGDRFIEIWNLVFMQFEQVSHDLRKNLPKPSIDTGMGLERIAAILQNKHDNYDIDLLRALILDIAQATGVDPDGSQKVSHRVIADHLRATSFLIADGVLPSNEGRGYVLRRIMRRAMRHAQLLGATDPLMHRLVPGLIQQMGEAFPELIQARSLISETLLLEEERFRRTLARGLTLLEEQAEGLSSGDVFSGETAFKLYDTYGFPLDLTEDALRQRHIKVDTDGFSAAMARQKAEARASWSGSGDMGEARIWFDLREAHGRTEFIGYDYEDSEAEVVALVCDGESVDKLSEGQSGWMLLNQTSFYGEAGGQVGDQGQAGNDKTDLIITDVKRQAEGALFAHAVTVSRGELSSGMQLKLSLNKKRRQAIRRNHSATHLLHESLRLTLGDHVAQKGSLVEPDRFRFDFSHHKPLSDEELSTVLELTNKLILQNGSVVTRVMPLDEARQSGARALFGEKYGDEVRVVSMGMRDDGKERFSVELCGGTHVKGTGEIGSLLIMSEQAVASGVRRIEAVTGEAALSAANENAHKLTQLTNLVKTHPNNLLTRISQILDDQKSMMRELDQLKRERALGGSGSTGEQKVETVGQYQLIARVFNGIDGRSLKAMIDSARQSLGSGVIAFVSRDEAGKASLVIGVTEDLTAKLSAVDLVRSVGEVLGAKGGGGRPDMAQTGGPHGEKAEEALNLLREQLKVY